MNITDSLHRPGSVEHSAWVRDVYIPFEGPRRWDADRQRVGAPSIGKRLIVGSLSAPKITVDITSLQDAFRQLTDILVAIDIDRLMRRLQSFGAQKRYAHPNSRLLQRSHRHRR